VNKLVLEKNKYPENQFKPIIIGHASINLEKMKL